MGSKFLPSLPKGGRTRLMREDADIKPHYTGHRKRLRERFLKGGADALADYELLELLLFAASVRSDVKPLAKMLIAKFKSFGGVLHATPEALAEIDGVNEAAIVAIKAAKAASERLIKEELSDKPIIKNWDQLVDYCRLQIGHQAHEEFHVLFLDSKLQLIAHERHQRGTVNHAPVYPREVVKRALELGASSMILVHNHPSGDVTPSKEDIDITKLIISAAKPLGIEVHDHLIIGGKKHFSFKSKGVI